jgi:transposase
MNHTNYKKWLQEKLFPNLKPSLVIVVDNASYHNIQINRHPTSNARKAEMLFWLDKHGIRHSSDMIKVELYDLIKMHKPQYETFAIDGLLAKHGHTMIRLPPYHPDLNPIEKIWGVVKNRVAAKNVTFKLQDVQQLAEENFAAVTEEEWAAVCRHVKVVEEEYMSKEHEIDSAMERIIINPDDDDDDDTSESSDDCDDQDMIGVGLLSSDSK